MTPGPSPTDLAKDRFDRFVSQHAQLIDWLFGKAEASCWGLTGAQFAQALYRSVEHRFRGAASAEAEVAAHLESLHVEDLALSTALAQGHEPAWEHFVRRYREDLYSAARTITGGGEARARELADSLYAALYGLGRRTERSERRSLFEYFHGRSKLSTWLRAVLSQRHVDALRAARHTEPLEETAGTDPAASPAPPALDPDRGRHLEWLQAALLEAIESLDPRDRLRLSFYYVHERTLAVIGRILGEHEATVSRHLERARREIRQRVERGLRAGCCADGSRPARAPLSEAQIRRCFEYALEEYPFDLTRALGATQAVLGPALREEKSATRSRKE